MVWLIISSINISAGEFVIRHDPFGNTLISVVTEPTWQYDWGHVKYNYPLPVTMSTGLPL